MEREGEGSVDLNHWWMPFTANSRFKQAVQPRMIVGAKGVHYTTSDGRELLDGMCGLMCSPLGHSRPEIAEAIAHQAAQLSYMPPFHHGHPLAFEAANKLREFLPADLGHIFFTNSGSESTETALKIALAYHHARGEGHRVRFVGRERAYHGVNFGGMSVGGIPSNRDAYGLGLPGVVHMRHTWMEENRYTPGMPAHGVELAEDLQRFCDQLGGRNIAACIVEPVAGSTGCLVPPDGYLQRLRQICDQHGILLIFDEVITGFGRVGENFASERFGVVPDLLCMAKGINNAAVPMGAVAVKPFIYETLTGKGSHRGIELFHGYTYSAHPVACASMLATLRIFQEEGLVQRAKALEPTFLDAVFSLQGLSAVTDIRGIGMMAAIDLRPTGTPGERGAQAVQDFFEEGVMVKITGDSVLLGPALVIKESEIAELIERIRKVLSRY